MSNRKYTEELLREAVNNSDSYIGVLRYLGIRAGGGPQAHITRMIRKFNIDHSHFTYTSIQDRTASNKRVPAELILVRLAEGSTRIRPHRLRRALEEMGVRPECKKCGQGEIWQGKFLRLEINHIDGDWMNCLFDNLEYICPNCHSQETETNLPHKYQPK